MKAAVAIQAALALLQGVLNATGQGKVLPPEVIPAVENAIAELLKVHGSDVTFGQLEELRIKLG